MTSLLKMSESSDSEKEFIIDKYLTKEAQPAYLKEKQKREEELERLKPLIEEQQKNEEIPISNFLAVLHYNQPDIHLKQFYVYHLLTNLDVTPIDEDPPCFKYIKENALPVLRIEFAKLDTLDEMLRLAEIRCERKAIKEAEEIQEEKITQIILDNLK